MIGAYFFWIYSESVGNMNDGKDDYSQSSTKIYKSIFAINVN
jgi:hypothetical protein